MKLPPKVVLLPSSLTRSRCPRLPSRLGVVAVLSLAVGLLTSTAAVAQDFVGTRGLGLGEAYRAIATGNDAIYMNPAGITQIPRYAAEAHYNFNLFDEHHEFDISVLDSKTAAFAAGLAYTLKGTEFTRRTTLKHTATAAMGYTIVPQLFSVGVGLKYVNLSDAVLGNYLNALTADLGALATLPGGVNLAAVGYNLVPFQSTEVPISAAFAAAWDLGPLSAWMFGGTPNFGPSIDASGAIRPPRPLHPFGILDGLTLSLDWYIEFFTLYGPQSRVSTGIEYLILEVVPVRAGYMWDQRSGDHLVSVGTGFIVPFFGLDIAFQQNVRDLDQRVFSLSLKFFLDGFITG